MEEPLIYGGRLVMYREIPDLLEPVAAEMQAVFEKLEQTVGSLANNLLDRYLPCFDWELLLPPGLTLFSGAALGRNREVVLPALMMLMMQLGNRLHHLAVKHHGKDRQMLILAGDYLDSHLYQMICDTGCYHLLGRISGVMAAVNFGNVFWERISEFQRTEEQLREGLRQRYGELLGESCALGALFAGAGPGEQEELQQMGQEFGIALGAMAKNLKLSLASTSFFGKYRSLADFARKLLHSRVLLSDNICLSAGK